MEHIIEYIRWKVSLGEPVALKKKEAAELLEVFNSYDAAQRMIAELENEVAEAEADLAEMTRKYMEFIREEITDDAGEVHQVAGPASEHV